MDTAIKQAVVEHLRDAKASPAFARREAPDLVDRWARGERLNEEDARDCGRLDALEQLLRSQRRLALVEAGLCAEDRTLLVDDPLGSLLRATWGLLGSAYGGCHADDCHRVATRTLAGGNSEPPYNTKFCRKCAEEHARQEGLVEGDFLKHRLADEIERVDELLHACNALNDKMFETVRRYR